MSKRSLIRDNVHLLGVPVLLAAMFHVGEVWAAQVVACLFGLLVVAYGLVSHAAISHASDLMDHLKQRD